jgi:hypothetical protein
MSFPRDLCHSREGGNPEKVTILKIINGGGFLLNKSLTNPKSFAKSGFLPSQE